MTLKACCQTHGTDKGCHGYADIYERLFAPLRDRPVSLLELGIHRGASLRMWAEWFPYGAIVGVDIDPEAWTANGGSKKITTHTVRQDDVSLGPFSAYHGGWDIVIDDASHVNELTAASLHILLPHVKPGGWYIIEDLKGSYRDMTPEVGKWPGMHCNRPGLSYKNDRETIAAPLFEMIRVMDAQGPGAMASVQFYPMLVAIQKGAG